MDDVLCFNILFAMNLVIIGRLSVFDEWGSLVYIF